MSALNSADMGHDTLSLISRGCPSLVDLTVGSTDRVSGNFEAVHGQAIVAICTHLVRLERLWLDVWNTDLEARALFDALRLRAGTLRELWLDGDAVITSS